MIDHVIIWVYSILHEHHGVYNLHITAPRPAAVLRLSCGAGIGSALLGEPEQSLPLAKPAGVLLSLFQLGSHSA